MSHSKKTRLYRLFEKFQCYILVFIITPGFYVFEMSVVRPTIVDTYEIGTTKHVFHIILSTFILHNVVGNMLMSIMFDSWSDKSNNDDDDDEKQCENCDVNRPKNVWHCKTCGVCVLKRDHHCFFFAKCIDFRNKRYYILYLIYVTISLIYSTYYNYYYVSSKFEGDMIIAAFRIINPMLRFIIPEPMGFKDLYLLFLFINIGLAVWSGWLVVFHMKNAVRGVTAREYRSTELFKTSQWRKNLLKVFGTKWYLAIICPLVDSPLLENEKDD
ncbi:probable palmitoyltransferase ZDHHC24 [Manduca sexta]|uniref:Palmitoyltransferase n=1 Tax=Manduca sexta TaxID=7130 RepID=A0A921ZLV8_MANSE|nr:probable palmitoyltransferase ZDHHC24 [Manduca sexta]KAG6459668.1 hypothetical protein O3G_MSEX011515 [Manduca sexta]